MAQFRDALWHSESHAPVAERSIDPLGVGSAPYEVREVLSVVATPSLKVVHDGVPIGFCCWCSIPGGGA